MKTRLALGLLSVLVSGCIFGDTRDYYVDSFCTIALPSDGTAMWLDIRIEGNVKCGFDLRDNGETVQLIIGGPWSDVAGGQQLSRQFFPIEQDCEAKLPLVFGTSIRRMRYRGLGHRVPSGEFTTAPVEEIEVELSYNAESQTYLPKIGPNPEEQVDCYNSPDSDRVCCLPIRPNTGNALDGGAAQ